MRRRLADDHGAGGDQGVDDERVALGHALVGPRRAEARGQAGHVDDVLDRNRQAVQRPARATGRELLLGLPGLRERELRRELDERAQLGLQRLRTLERRLRARHRPGGQGHGGGSMTGSASGACAAAAATSSAARCSRRW